MTRAKHYKSEGDEKVTKRVRCDDKVSTNNESQPLVIVEPTKTPCPAQVFINNNIKTLIKKPGNNIYEEYTGYINYKNFPTTMIKLMGSNRIVNQDRVKNMIDENIEKLKTTGTYEDFNTVKLLVDKSVITNEVEFYIADGQHRLNVAQGLLNINPTIDNNIHVTLTIVDTEKDAIDYLMHFQNCLSPDYRLFSINVKARQILQTTLDAFRDKWPKAFNIYDERQISLVHGDKSKNYRIDVERPHLSDGVIADFIKGPCVINAFAEGNVTSELLDIMNNYLKTLYPQNKTEKISCMFGYLRSREDVDRIRRMNEKFKTHNLPI